MSWQSYVDTNLVGTKHVHKAAIVGLNGGAKWAASAGFEVSPADAQALAAGFSNPGGLQAGGIKAGGEKYMFIRADARTIQGKKGAGGIVAVKTKQAILIAIYNDTIQPGQCTMVVEKLADYLIEQNF